MIYSGWGSKEFCNLKSSCWSKSVKDSSLVARQVAAFGSPIWRNSPPGVRRNHGWRFLICSIRLWRNCRILSERLHLPHTAQYLVNKACTLLLSALWAFYSRDPEHSIVQLALSARPLWELQKAHWLALSCCRTAHGYSFCRGCVSHGISDFAADSGVSLSACRHNIY